MASHSLASILKEHVNWTQANRISVVTVADQTGLTVNQSDYDVNFNLMEALVYYNPHSVLERKHVNQALLAIVVRVWAPRHHKVIVLAEAMSIVHMYSHLRRCWRRSDGGHSDSIITLKKLLTQLNRDEQIDVDDEDEWPDYPAVTGTSTDQPEVCSSSSRPLVVTISDVSDVPTPAAMHTMMGAHCDSLHVGDMMRYTDQYSRKRPAAADQISRRPAAAKSKAASTSCKKGIKNKKGTRKGITTHGAEWRKKHAQALAELPPSMLPKSDKHGE